MNATCFFFPLADERALVSMWSNVYMPVIVIATRWPIEHARRGIRYISQCATMYTFVYVIVSAPPTLYSIVCV